MLARPRFERRGVFGVSVHLDGDKDELGGVVERKFSGADGDEGDPILADNAGLVGVIGDLGRIAEDAKTILAGVEDGCSLEKGDSAHGGREVKVEEVGGVGDLSFGEGGLPAAEVASSKTLFTQGELGEDKGASIRGRERHVGGRKNGVQLAQDLRSERKSEFSRGYDCGLGLLGLEMCG